MKDLYKILGISKDANLEEITKAYRALSKKTHPDVGGDEKEFHLVAIAGEVLRDTSKKKHYDETGECKDNKDSANLSEQLLASEFFSMFSSLSSNKAESTDMVAFLVEKLMDRKAGLGQAAVKLEAEIKAQKDILKRLSLKEGAVGKGTIITVLEDNIQMLSNELLANEQQINVVDDAMLLAVEYNYEFEPDAEEELLSRFASRTNPYAEWIRRP